eukprot:gene6510-biopygen22385
MGASARSTQGFLVTQEHQVDRVPRLCFMIRMLAQGEQEGGAWRGRGADAKRLRFWHEWRGYGAGISCSPRGSSPALAAGVHGGLVQHVLETASNLPLLRLRPPALQGISFFLPVGTALRPPTQEPGGRVGRVSDTFLTRPIGRVRNPAGHWRERGAGVARAWYGRGAAGVVPAWCGRGAGVVPAWCGRGAGVARAWRGHGAGVARAWPVTPGACAYPHARAHARAWAWAHAGDRKTDGRRHRQAPGQARETAKLNWRPGQAEQEGDAGMARAWRGL